jgi:hypothetical protein
VKRYVLDGSKDLPIKKKYQVLLSRSWEEAAEDYAINGGGYPQMLIFDTFKGFYLVPFDLSKWSLDDLMDLEKFRIDNK